MRSDIAADVGAEFRSRGHWTDERIADAVIEVARRRGDDVAVVDEAGAYSYRELLDRAMRFAGWLTANGVRRGSVVTVQLPNWREFAVVLLATELCGACINPVLPAYGRHELEHVVRTCNSRVLVLPETHRSRDDFAERAAEVRAECPDLGAIVVVRGSATPREGFTAFDAALDHEPLAAPSPFSGDDPVIVAFTSGTEAAPKGCVHSHNTALFALRTKVGILGLDHRDAIFMPSPVGHAIGTQWGVRLALHLGSRVVLQDRWDPAVAAELMTRYACTFTLATTPFITDLVGEVMGSRNAYDLSAFRMAVTAGAPIPRSLYDEVHRVLGAELLAGYGQAECYTVALVRPGDDAETKTSCDGRVLPGVEVRVVGDDGDDVAVDEIGECWTRGPHTMLGYLNPTAADREYRPGGWLRSGDLVRIDERGRLRVVGRKKEIIIRGGANISPREIEELLEEHPAVGSIAVVGYPDDRLGERVCAVVVPARDEPLGLSDLTEYLEAAGVARFKWPERIETLDQFPRTASGKVRKSELARWLAGTSGQLDKENAR